MREKSVALEIDAHLKNRLSALASKSGRSFTEFTESILRSHADDHERLAAEYEEDERRWQRYLSKGHTVSLTEMRSKLSTLALQAAKQAAQ